MKVEFSKNGEVVLTKELGDGSYKIGRSPACEIQLNSTGISKQHALLVIKGRQAAILDLGSSNGVFVNGILVKKQKVQPGDDVRLAEFRLHLGDKGNEWQRQSANELKKLATEELGYDGNAALVTDPGTKNSLQEDNDKPIQEKLLDFVNDKILKPFFSVIENYDWRWILAIVLIGTLLSSVLLSVVPIIRWGTKIGTREAILRAHTLASQVVRENYRILSKTQDETRLSVDLITNERGVLSAYIVDPKSQVILAPTKYYGKSAIDPYYTLAIRKVLIDKEEQATVMIASDSFVVAQPIKVRTSETEEDTIKAIVLIAFEIGNEITSTFQPMVEASLFAVLFSLLAYFLIYKMFSFPLSSLQAQLDSAMKGENVSITSIARLDEFEKLATTINFAVARLRQGGVLGDITPDDTEVQDNLMIASVKNFDFGTSDAILLLDREKRVCFVGKALEEMLAMRNQYAKGQNISEACKDPGFAGTAISMADAVLGSLGEFQVNNLDINGINREMHVVPLKSSSGEIRFILLTVKLGNGN